MNYIKKHYKIIVMLLAAFMIIVLLFKKTTIKVSGYSVDNLYNTIKELSSDKYKGRRFGTKENMDAVNYVEEKFKSIGLEPAGKKGTYLNSYNVVAKSSAGAPIIEILDKENRIIKEYKFGEDFTETGMFLSTPGEITSGFTFIDYPYGLKSNEFNADKKIAIMHSVNIGESQRQNLYIALKKAGYEALITLLPKDRDMKITYSSVGKKTLQKSGYEIPTLQLSVKAKGELLEYSNLGYKIHLNTTTDGVQASISDVMGMIPGKTDDYLFITAHIDHVGTSADGRIYPGALDNASGIAAMLEIARYVKSQNVKPNKNIVFIAFNGEEGGCLGSYNYIRRPIFPLYKTTVINLDMIGASKDVPIKIAYNSIYNQAKGISINPSSKLRYQLGNLADELGIPYSVEYGFNSDHGYFNLFGVPAVTIGDKDSSKIHTTEDDINNIGKENIDRAMNLVMNYISFSSYSNGAFVGNSLVLQDTRNFIKTQYPLIMGVLIVFILLLVMRRNSMLNTFRDRIKIPVLTIILIILMTGIISYFPIRYPYAPIALKGAANLFGEGVLSIFKAPILWPIYFLYTMPGVIVLAITKQRELRWNYKGNGKEYDMVFYISMLLTIIISTIGSVLLYNKQLYYAITPDFARTLIGKLILHLIIGGIAYALWVALRLEIKSRSKGYKSLITFSLIFLILLSSFYMPITINKYVINTNLSNASFSGDSKPIE